jgi:hypothetical protein
MPKLGFELVAEDTRLVDEPDQPLIIVASIFGNSGGMLERPWSNCRCH